MNPYTVYVASYLTGSDAKQYLSQSLCLAVTILLSYFCRYNGINELPSPQGFDYHEETSCCISGDFALFLSALTVSAQTASLGLVAPDTEVVITGRLDGSNSSFSGSVRLLFTGEGSSELTMLSSALTNDFNQIDRSDVVLEGTPILAARRPADVRVTINNVTAPGTYTGELEFYLADEAKPLRVPITATIGVVPQVTAVTDNLTLNLVRCVDGFECGLAAIFFPGARQLQVWDVQLENQAALDAPITTATLFVRNTETGVRSDALTTDIPAALPADDVGAAKVRVDSSQMEPGQYTGSLHVHVEGADSTLTVPI